MSEWNCQKCKVNFKEKPTYTTSCPLCNDRLDMGNIDGFKEYGESSIVHNRCVMCDRWVNPEKALKLKNPHQVNEFQKTDVVHKACRDRILKDKKESKYLKKILELKAIE